MTGNVHAQLEGKVPAQQRIAVTAVSLGTCRRSDAVFGPCSSSALSAPATKRWTELGTALHVSLIIGI